MNCNLCHFCTAGILIIQCIKHNKTAEDTLRYGSLGIELQKIYDEMEKEKSEALGGPAAGEATADDTAGDKNDGARDPSLEDDDAVGFIDDEDHTAAALKVEYMNFKAAAM